MVFAGKETVKLTVLAQVLLALLYFDGKGVTQDYQEAACWFQLAAEQGNSLALGTLGLMYYSGQGIPQNYVKSYMCFDLAEKGGGKSGVDIRDTLAENMTPEQIAEAQQLVREWKPKGK